MTTSYIKTTRKHLEELAPKLRKEDKDEIEASTGSTDYLEMLLLSWELSSECLTVICDKEVVGVFGVRELKGHGIPWLLGSDNVAKDRKYFLRESRMIISRWLKTYSLLFNYVDCRNDTSIKWLKFLGFKMIRKLTLTDPTKPFYEFVNINV